MRHNNNVEQYNKYTRRLSLIGNPIFVFETDEQKDEVRIVNYLYDKNMNKSKIIIPSFVTSIEEGLFDGCCEDMQIIHKNNRIKNMTSLFEGYNGKRLDLSMFDTSGVEIIDTMFFRCEELEHIDISKCNLESVKSAAGLYSYCHNLKDIKMSAFGKEIESINLSNMTKNCDKLEVMSVGGLEYAKTKQISYISMKNKMYERVE